MARDRSPLSALLLVAVLVAITPGSAAAGGPCSRVAGPGRNDAVQRLVNSLHAGQTGCLRSGTYYGDVQFGRGGRRGSPVTLTVVPGQAATVIGRMWLPKGANWIDVTHLHLDGRNGALLPSPTIDSGHDLFDENEVTNDNTAICFELGSDGGYGMARNTLIEHNRIHNCGVLPPTNHDHGIYVANSYGAKIIDNWIYNNADRGVQLYWNAQHTTIAGNVIDHNAEGIIISGDNGHVSSHNLVIGNAITNSTERADVESYWPTSARGVGNLVIGNCVYGGRKTIDMSGGGFAARDNVTTDPHYADAAQGNYSLPSGTVCNTLVTNATDVRGRSSAIIHAVHSARPKRQLRLWVNARERRGRGRAKLLVIRGGLTRRSLRIRDELVGIDIWSGRGWHQIATVHGRRNGSFHFARWMHRRRHRTRLRVRVYGGGEARSYTAWA